MEMPEGWEKMKVCSETVKSFSLLPPYEGEVSIIKCVELMKEMAEALEKCTVIYVRTDWDLTSAELQHNERAWAGYEVLKKFKEWK